MAFGEQPSAAKWNILGTNDASFNDGTGIADGAATKSNVYCFRAYDSGSSTLTDGVASKVNLATEVYDYGADFSGGTYTVPVAGVYSFSGTWQMGTIATGVDMFAAVYVNGAEASIGGRNTALTNGACHVSCDLLLAAGNTVEFYAFQNSAGNEGTQTGASQTWFSGHLIRQV